MHVCKNAQPSYTGTGAVVTSIMDRVLGANSAHPFGGAILALISQRAKEATSPACFQFLRQQVGHSSFTSRAETQTLHFFDSHKSFRSRRTFEKSAADSFLIDCDDKCPGSATLPPHMHMLIATRQHGSFSHVPVWYARLLEA